MDWSTWRRISDFPSMLDIMFDALINLCIVISVIVIIVLAV